MTKIALASLRPRIVGLCAQLLWLTVALLPQALAQTPTVTSPPTPSPTIAVPSPTPVPLAEVPLKADDVLKQLHDRKVALSSDPTSNAVKRELPLLTEEIDLRLTEATRILAGTPSLDTLRELESGWQKSRDTLAEHDTDLVRRGTELDAKASDARNLQSSWSETLDAAQQSNAPSEITERIRQVISDAKRLLDDIGSFQAAALKLQTRVAEQIRRIDDVLRSIRSARDKAMNQLLVRDSAPVWSGQFWRNGGAALTVGTQESFRDQQAFVFSYLAREHENLRLHILLFLLFFGSCVWARRVVHRWSEGDPSLAQATAVFEAPLAMALLLSFLITPWVYPEAPRLFRAFLGAVALIPTVVVLRQLVKPKLLPVLYSLLVFYLIDQIRLVVLSVPEFSRTLFLCEIVGAIACIAWVLRSERLQNVDGVSSSAMTKLLSHGAQLGAAALGASFFLNVLGYVSMANLLGTAVLSSAYYAAFLYAAVRVLDGITLFVLRVPPLAMFRLIRQNTALLRSRTHRFYEIVAGIIWTVVLLDALSLRAKAIDLGKQLFSTELGLGALSFSIGSLISCVLTVWITILVSRFGRWVLEEELYPLASVSRGLSYAISRVFHYLVMLIGFFLAMAALGLDMTKFTVLAGAVGVGVGFGLQNIINNFFSGLIVLFERPVRVGDVIQIGDVEGVVERIGIRASFIRTTHGSEAIIPNAKLISEQVINWTFSNRQRVLEVPLTVALGTDADRLMTLVKQAASGHPRVLSDPAPEVVATKFGADSITFELRACTNRFSEWVETRSELTLAIQKLLVAEKIVLK
ncbi:MAG: mechanosensitive ion channel [Bdellovibrionota bacterium]